VVTGTRRGCLFAFRLFDATDRGVSVPSLSPVWWAGQGRTAQGKTVQYLLITCPDLNLNSNEASGEGQNQ